MKNTLRYLAIPILLFFGISLIAQNAPAPGGNGPLQNPRPTSSNTGGGTDQIHCPESHNQVWVPNSIFAYIDVNSSDPIYTVPSNLPP